MNQHRCNLTGSLLRLAMLHLLLAALLPATAFAEGWRVIPIRLDFDHQARSGVITVANDSDERLSFSISASEWTQTAEGKDQYTETADIMFFPKALNVEPHTERVIRAGIKVPALKTEKTYRLFIKQETAPQERAGTNVAIAIRFGVPLFSKPLDEQVHGAITGTALNAGTLTVGLNNHGNTHFQVKTIQLSGTNASGTEILSQKLDGGYLLAGSTRTFAASLPENICPELGSINIQVVADRIKLDGKIDVDKAMCLSR